MKLLQISDIHLNIQAKRKMSFYKDKRHLSLAKDRVQRVKNIIEYSYTNYDIDGVVFTGDIFDKKTPYPEDYNDFISILDFIKNDWRSQYFVMAGNHDEQNNVRKSPLYALEHLFPKSNGDSKEGLAISAPQAIDFNGFNIILCPWGTTLNQMWQFKEHTRNNTGMFFMHLGVLDGLTHWAENELELAVRTLEELQELQAYIGIGHYHGQSLLSYENHEIWYCGSPECFNFGEEDQDKGVLLWSWEDGTCKVISLGSNYIEYKTYGKEFLTLNNDNFYDEDCYIRLKDEVSLKIYKEMIEKAKRYPCHGILNNLVIEREKLDKTIILQQNKKDSIVDRFLNNEENKFSETDRKRILEKHLSIESKLEGQ